MFSTLGSAGAASGAGAAATGSSFLPQATKAKADMAKTNTCFFMIMIAFTPKK
jgi:hypothetical protein